MDRDAGPAGLRARLEAIAAEAAATLTDEDKAQELEVLATRIEELRGKIDERVSHTPRANFVGG